MSTRIQDIVSGWYFRTPDEWSETMEAAAVFPTSAEAIRYCRGMHLEKVRVVVSEGESCRRIYISPFGEAVHNHARKLDQTT